MRAARRAAVLGDADAVRDVAEPIADQTNAHERRRLADGADAVLLIDQDSPDLLRRALPLTCALPGGGPEQLERPLHLGILRLDALLPGAAVPDRELRRHVGLVR